MWYGNNHPYAGEPFPATSSGTGSQKDIRIEQFELAATSPWRSQTCLYFHRTFSRKFTYETWDLQSTKESSKSGSLEEKCPAQADTRLVAFPNNSNMVIEELGAVRVTDTRRYGSASTDYKYRHEQFCVLQEERAMLDNKNRNWTTKLDCFIPSNH